MKNLKIYSLLILTASLIFVGCKDSNNKPQPPVSPDTQFSQTDQVGRPAINTVFVTEDTTTSVSEKDEFNTTIPSNMQSAYQSSFQDRLLALNAGYSNNLLGQDASTFTSFLADDALNVATSGNTRFFTSTSDFLNGNELTDDEIDIELILIFGGPDGSDNPGLTSDNVDNNDKPFLSTFPYLAADNQ